MVVVLLFAAFIGDTFAHKKTEAFACQNFWSGIAMAGVFAYSSHLCFDIQTYILSAVAVLSVMGYVTLFCRMRRDKSDMEQTAQGPV